MRPRALKLAWSLLAAGGCGTAASCVYAQSPNTGERNQMSKLHTPQHTCYQYVIAGGGTAARAAAQVLSTHDPLASLLIVAPWWPGMIPGAHTGTTTLVAGHKVTALDSSSKTVTLSNGHTVNYERVLLAVGADAPPPPIGTVIAPNARLLVGGVRSAADNALINAVFSRTAPGERAHFTIVGGGWVALSAGADLLSRGADATFVYAEPAFLARHVPRYISGELRRRLAFLSDAGADFLSYAAIRAVAPGARIGEADVHAGVVFDRAAAVQFRTDRVLLAPTQPPAARLHAPALEVRDDAFVVNRELSAASDVYAAGACAMAAGARDVGWTSSFAETSGEHAARNMMGEREPFDAPRFHDVRLPALRARLRVVGEADGARVTLGYFNVAREAGGSTCGGALRDGVLFYVTQTRVQGSINTFSVTGGMLWDGVWEEDALDEELESERLDALLSILDAPPKERGVLEEELDAFASKFAGVVRESEARSPETGRVLWRRHVASRNVALPKEEILWMDDDPRREYSSAERRKAEAYSELLRRSAGLRS